VTFVTAVHRRVLQIGFEQGGIMNFNRETKVNEIALSNPGARHILEDAGIDYCCGGGKSLGEACRKANVAEAEILLRLRENAQQVDPEESQWVSAPLAELTKHIRERHHQYVRLSIPRLSVLLAKLCERHGTRHAELSVIEKLFADVAREMLMHMQKEEQILFPYIDALERAANGKEAVEPPFFQTVKNPIHSMMREHDFAGELLRQIRTASSEYKAPADGCTTFKAAYQALEEFEKDLHLHVHLENNILFPRAVEMESSVLA
jgi:regulator of cell morphogenesis and NO signaling